MIRLAPALLLLATVIVAAPAAPLAATAESPRPLEQRIQELERQLEALDARLGRTTIPAAAPSDPDERWVERYRELQTRDGN